MKVTWTGTLPGGANADSDCTASASDALNDHHRLSLVVPSGFYAGNSASLKVTITPDTPAAADIIATVVPPKGAATSADDGSNGSAEQVLLTNPAAGSFDVLACTFAGGPQPYTGTATLHTFGPADKAILGGIAHGVTPPAYANHSTPSALGNDAGEPSVSVSWKSGAVFLQAGLQTDKVVFDAAGTPTWTDVSSTQTSLTSLDPIGASDDAQGRIFVSQLTGFDSLSAFSDDDGKTWTSSQGGGIPSGVDHQTVGFGPYPQESGAGPATTFPDAVYYCSQELATAFCARSDTGGIAFGAGVPIYTTECGGLHGHVRVAPDGTVYVPNKSCTGNQAVAVSRDAGTTWTVHPVPLSNSGDSDPSIASGKDGTAYYGFVNADGHPEVSVSRTHGSSWARPVDVGASAGIANASFPEVIAGDSDRAAIAFLGTRTPGASQDPDFGKDKTKTRYTGAEYHLFVSTTYDRGLTWSTVDATPKDPVQRGKICLGGTTGCGAHDRNLLDFMDIQVDKQGRVLVGWADGCMAACVDSSLVTANGFTSKGVVTRQTSGKPLFKAFDPATTAPARWDTPATAPVAHQPTTAATRTLPATGLPLAVPLTGAALLLLTAGRRRRRHA